MAKYNFSLIGDIGEESFFFSETVSLNLVNQHLDAAEGKHLDITVSSFGGSVSEALLIKNAIKEYKKNHKAKVNVKYVGFNASASTFFMADADKIEMDENGLFLVHKAMNYVDVYGMLNEDDINDVISSLEKIKESNQKIDSIIVNIYANRSNKDQSALLGLMEEDKWLSADEALEWGFIDSIAREDVKQINSHSMSRMVAKASAEGLPAIPRKGNKDNQIKDKSNTNKMEEKTIIDGIVNGVKDLFKKDESNSENVLESKEVVNHINAKIEALDGEFANQKEELVNNHKNELESMKAENAAKVEEFENKIKELEAANERLSSELELKNNEGTQVPASNEGNPINKGQKLNEGQLAIKNILNGK